MTTDLRDLLDDLTDDVGDVVPPRDLWTRGQRFRRRRLAGYAAIAVVTGLLGTVLVVASWQSRVVEPAARPAGEVGIPDRVYEPPAWMGTLEPGSRLLAVTYRERPRRWWGSTMAAVGLSAETGEYGYLDLPQYDGSEAPVVSPDGRRVAYWTEGPAAGRDTPTISGVAVYDADTGQISEAEITAKRGAQPGVLGWIDDTRLLVANQRLIMVDDPKLGDLTRQAPALVWRMGTSPERATLLADEDVEGVESGLVVLDDGSALDLDSGERLAGDLTGNGWVGAPGSNTAVRDRWVARVGDEPLSDRFPNEVVVQRLTTGEQSARSRTIPHSGRTMQVVSWLDEHTIAVVRRTREPDALDDTFDLEALDVRTGRTRHLSDLGELSGLRWAWAEDLLGAPSVPGVEPPSRMDPRAEATLWLMLAGGVLVVVVAWRRRVQP